MQNWGERMALRPEDYPEKTTEKNKDNENIKEGIVNTIKNVLRGKDKTSKEGPDSRPLSDLEKESLENGIECLNWKKYSWKGKAQVTIKGQEYEIIGHQAKPGKKGFIECIPLEQQ